MHETSATAHPAPSPAQLSRRGFLTRSILVGLGVAAVPAANVLAACSPKELQPDPLMLELFGTLKALERSPIAEGTSLFTIQSAAVASDVQRQCGVSPTTNGDSDDVSASSAQCIASLDTVAIPTDTPTVAIARAQMLGLLPHAADGGQASLLAGLHSALCTVEDNDAGASAIDWAIVDTPLGDDGSNRRKKASTALAGATARIHEAVWLTGRIQPFAGPTTTTVTTVAERLRRIRDVAVAVTAVPAAASYTFPINTPAPIDPTGSAVFLLSAVHAATVDLRRAVKDVARDDRVTVAMWCAVSARCEAAIEDALNRNPLSVAIRGE